MHGQGMPIDQDVNFFLKVLLELESVLSSEDDFLTTCQNFLQQLMGTLLIGKGGILLWEGSQCLVPSDPTSSSKYRSSRRLRDSSSSPGVGYRFAWIIITRNPGIGTYS